MLTDQLEAGITDLFQSRQYAAYLWSLSKLHHYSYGNIFLIKLQCPHASMVASPNYLNNLTGVNLIMMTEGEISS